MSLPAIVNPYEIFLDLVGAGLNGGQVYIGIAGMDPQTNPQAVYWDAAATIPATQPLPTMGGYTMYLGSPAQAFTATTYSIKVLDVHGVQVFYKATVTPSQKWLEFVSPTDYGASPLGAIDARAAFVSANAAGGTIWVPKGQFRIASNLTLTNPVYMQGGAQFIIPTGVTLTLNGTIQSGLQQIFVCTGTGKVVFGPTNSIGYPEWWGAVGDGATDCFAAINASIVAASITQLQAAPYYVSDTVLLRTDCRTLQGSGFYFNGSANSCTRLIVSGATKNVISVGLAANPGSINSYLKTPRVANLQLTRDLAPAISGACAGLDARYTVFMELENVRSEQSMSGFRFQANVNSKSTNCYGFRSLAGTGAGTDFFYGFYAYGGEQIGSGGNASIYFDRCGAGQGGVVIANSNGFYADAGFADIFIDAFESANLNIGLNFNGTGAASFGCVDVQITNPTVDGYLTAGILIQNTNVGGAITITGGYAAPAASGTTTPCAGLMVSANFSAVSAVGFQVIGGTNAASTGLYVFNSKNVFTSNNRYMDCGLNPVFLSGALNCRISDFVANHSVVASGGAAVTLSASCSRNVFTCLYDGAASKVTAGYNAVGVTNTFNEFNCSGLDPTGITGGSGNKLVINGTQITAVGLSGNNYASGVMA